MYPFLLLLVAYVIGSVPSGLIVGRVFFNTDLRDYGSKNIGATNAYRVLGAPAGLCVLIADVGKGVLGVYLGQTIGNIYDPALTVYCMIMGGLLALIGHSASVFLHFKGGKGVATGLGIILYLAPVETAIVFFVWCVIVGLLVPLTMWYFKEPWPVFIFGTVAALIVIVRHKDNLIRLLQGKELKVERIEKK